MKIRITKASDWKYEEIITMNSMKELSNFIKEFGEIIVSEDDTYNEYDLLITIYDDYVE